MHIFLFLYQNSAAVWSRSRLIISYIVVEPTEEAVKGLNQQNPNNQGVWEGDSELKIYWYQNCYGQHFSFVGLKTFGSFNKSWILTNPLIY